MARMPYGLMGPLIGRIGNVVVVNGKYGPYIRSMPRKKRDRPTPAQKIQRSKFAAVSRFLSPMRDLLTITFNIKGSKKTAWGEASSYNARNAIYTSGQKQKILYSAALVSQGSLPGAWVASAAVTAPVTITFNWEDNSNWGSARPYDKAILVIYCESLKKCVYITDGAYRNSGTDAIQVPAFSGKTVQTWLAFISANGKEIAPSVYTGELKL